MILGGRILGKLFSENGSWAAYRLGNRTHDLHIGPNSIDVTLGDQILIPHIYFDHEQDKNVPIFVDPTNCDYSIYSPGVLPWNLEPGAMILGVTQERFDCSHAVTIGNRQRHFAPMIEGRSTFARLGLSIHSSAGFGDYGFNGCFTLEIINQGMFTLKITAGLRLGQVFFMEVEQPLEYKGVYNSKTILGPILGKDRV